MKGMFDIYQSITNRSVLKQLSSKQITYCNHTDFQGKILFSTVRPTLLILFYKMVIIIAEAVLFWKDSISHFFPTYSSFFFFSLLKYKCLFLFEPCSVPVSCMNYIPATSRYLEQLLDFRQFLHKQLFLTFHYTQMKVHLYLCPSSI